MIYGQSLGQNWRLQSLHFVWALPQMIFAKQGVSAVVSVSHSRENRSGIDKQAKDFIFIILQLLLHMPALTRHAGYMIVRDE